ncbi:MAG TPA: phenylalanine--tRNA ligase subunit alpha [Polyangiaceae bacterium]|jgi:phenylalanyl-tRNA synthetase alpha chain
MKSELDALETEALAAIVAAESEAALRALEVRYFGKKGELTRVLRAMGGLSPEERPLVGRRANEIRAALESAVKERARALESERIARLSLDPFFDATLPAPRPAVGALHPVTLVTDHVEDVFRAMGFLLLDYYEVETDFFNFEALNIPKTHPARDMQDTFWLEDENLLRTHTSSGQVRAMKEYAPPFRAIFPGRAFRYERTDASHEHTFYQLEGLMIDAEVSVANLVHSMQTLLGAIFERDVEVRLRPGYFPFVEPGFELDIQCQVCDGKGCPVCKYSSWVELLPCGLVHPNVLRFGGVDPEKWSGWAFGLGLSRLVMMKYRVDDIRRLLGADLDFNRQFVRG